MFGFYFIFNRVNRSHYHSSLRSINPFVTHFHGKASVLGLAVVVQVGRRVSSWCGCLRAHWAGIVWRRAEPVRSQPWKDRTGSASEGSFSSSTPSWIPGKPNAFLHDLAFHSHGNCLILKTIDSKISGQSGGLQSLLFFFFCVWTLETGHLKFQSWRSATNNVSLTSYVWPLFLFSHAVEETWLLSEKCWFLHFFRHFLTFTFLTS